MLVLTVSKLLQISRIWEEEHGSDKYARFRCLSCLQFFSLSVQSCNWKFCPVCGKNIEIVKREIPEKRYFDNFGTHIHHKNGNWIHLKAPVFHLIREFWNYFCDKPHWEQYETFSSRVGSHRDLKHFIRSKDRDDRFRLVASPVLPLP